MDRAANLAPLHLKAVGESGSIEKGRMDRILEQNRKTGQIHFAKKEVDTICSEDIL